ncbi:hypothetical protein Pelo_489 [Pelomyxa schiedti]|nr:hypothetical protein Pelo_489 [Pelomyxa schiedti]
MLPSGLRTSTTGAAHGLVDGCITPWESILEGQLARRSLSQWDAAILCFVNNARISLCWDSSSGSIFRPRIKSRFTFISPEGLPEMSRPDGLCGGIRNKHRVIPYWRHQHGFFAPKITQITMYGWDTTHLDDSFSAFDSCVLLSEPINSQYHRDYEASHNVGSEHSLMTLLKAILAGLAGICKVRKHSSSIKETSAPVSTLAVTRSPVGRVTAKSNATGILLSTAATFGLPLKCLVDVQPTCGGGALRGRHRCGV